MRVLVFSVVPIWEKHHLESIEIAAQHLEAGDAVWIWSCMGALRSCPANPFHDRVSCISCRSLTRRTRRLELLSGAHKIDLELPQLRADIVESVPRSADGISNFTYMGAPIGQLVLSQLHDELREPFAPRANIESRGRELAIDGCRLFEAARTVIQKHNIDRVYAFNGRHVSEGPVLWAAQSLGVDAIAHDCGVPSGRIHTVKGTSVHSYGPWTEEGRRFVEMSPAIPDQDLMDEGTAYFRNQELGTHPYDGFVHFAERFQPSSLRRSGERPLLVIFTSSGWEYSSFPEYRPSDSEFSDQYATYNAICNDPALLDTCEIWVRWHPNLANAGDLERSLIQKSVNSCTKVIHILPEDTASSYDLLEQADVVLGWASTVLVEATFRGKPSISLAPTPFDAFDVTFQVRSVSELIQFMRSVPPPKSRRAALLYGYWSRTMGEMDFVWCRRGDDGRIRVGGEIYSIWLNRLRGWPGYRSLLRGLRWLVVDAPSASTKGFAMVRGRGQRSLRARSAPTTQEK
jgi:hypothetical protein